MIRFDRSWLRRLPAVTGVVFGVGAFVRGGGDDAAPTSSSTGAQIADYAYHHGLSLAVYNLELWMFLSLMVFSLVLYSRLRAAEPVAAIGAKVAVAACITSVAIKLGSFPAVYALYSSPVKLDPNVAQPLWTIGEFAFTVSMLVEALSMAAIGFSGLVHGGIPRWLAATAGIIGISLAAGFTLGGNFSIAPTLAWMGWMVVAGVALLITSPRVATGHVRAPIGREAAATA